MVVNHQVNKRHAKSGLARSAMQPLPDLIPVATELTMETAVQFYRVKCQDLKLTANKLAEKRFVEQFMSSIHQKSLKFQGLGLGPGCLLLLVQILYQNKQFMVLDLSLNQAGDEGATLLAQFFSADPMLIHVNLRSNGIGVEGCSKIFTGLMDNNHITSLDMGAIGGIERNRMGTKGCRALGEMLSKNESLSSLNVSMCGVTADGCGYIGQALALNTCLSSLDVTAIIRCVFMVPNSGMFWSPRNVDYE